MDGGGPSKIGVNYHYCIKSENGLLHKVQLAPKVVAVTLKYVRSALNSIGDFTMFHLTVMTALIFFTPKSF